MKIEYTIGILKYSYPKVLYNFRIMKAEECSKLHIICQYKLLGDSDY